MKFAHEFMQTLESEDFPREWQASAIQYKQLKKCIKRVQKELQALGLSVELLKDGRGPVFEYMFDGGCSWSVTGARKRGCLLTVWPR